MTLLELTVGLVVTGLVIAAGYAAFTTIIDRREGAAVANAESAHAALLRGELMRWLDGATPSIPQSITDPQVTQELNLITRAETPMHTPTTGVRLFVDDGSDGYGTGLVAVLKPDVGTDSMRVLIDPDIRAMAVQYLVRVDGTPQWLSTESVQSQTPLAIRLSLAAYTPQLAAALAMPIEAPTGASR